MNRFWDGWSHEEDISLLSEGAWRGVAKHSVTQLQVSEAWANRRDPTKSRDALHSRMSLIAIPRSRIGVAQVVGERGALQAEARGLRTPFTKHPNNESKRRL